MRLFDFMISLTGMVVLSPVFIVIAILVKISSKGPIIYFQDRVGRHGLLFSLYKFRTMIDRADKMGTSVTTGNDPRVTKIGRFLRKTKLDELPQLWNVLKGDMSFVGPRPDVPEIVERYSSDMKRILNVRPGITSNATLHLKNEEDLLSLANEPDRAYEEIFLPAKVKLAMEHVEKSSFVYDFMILLKTVWALTGGRLLPRQEHLFVKEIRQKIQAMNINNIENKDNQTHIEVR